jgi:cell division septum initiation protein DivIVA
MASISGSSTSMRDSREHSSVLTARSAGGFAILVAALWAGPVSAQVQRSGGAPNALLMQQLQQAVSDRNQLQTENSKLKKDMDDLKKQLAAAQQQANASKAGVAHNEAAVAAARASTEATQKSLDETKAKMQELVGRFRETVTTMRGIETERSQLRQQLAASQSQFDQCAQDNFALYQVNSEVLDRYAHQGAFTYLVRSEPFTKLKRTQIDNLVIEYRQRAEDLRLKKTATSGSAPGPNSSPPLSGSAAPAPSVPPPKPK